MTRRVTSGEAQRFDFRRGAERVVLADGLAGLSFAYFGPDRARQTPKWHDRWIGREALPRLVRLAAAGAAGYWPGLVVAPMIDPPPR